MFNREKKKQRLMETVGMIKPTSKFALKQHCLYLCDLDVTKAGEMYDFLVKDLEELPPVEEQKNFIQNIGGQVDGLFSWMRKNQDMLSQGADLVRGIIAKRKGIPTNPLPPING